MISGNALLLHLVVSLVKIALVTSCLTFRIHMDVVTSTML